jgi:outer membrane protein OmpA-like peptidoglycan-associated protein
MLEANHEQLQDLQSDIDALKQAQRISEADKALQLQIDQLREVVEQLVQSRSIDRPRAPELVPNLPGEVTLQFGKGETALNGAGVFVVSEVIDLLARNPEINVMVTGYADKTGSSEANAIIARQRAQSVRNALTSSGLDTARVVLNQFGDLKSSGINPNDRKVVITFIQAP